MSAIPCYTDRSDMTKKPRAKRKNAAATALGRLGGRANTAKQNAARAQNAQRAGRPGRVCNHCGEPVLGGHKRGALDQTCGAHGWHWKARHDPATTSTPTVPTVAQWHATTALLRDLLTAFEGEDDSVRTEHAALLTRLADAVARF